MKSGWTLKVLLLWVALYCLVPGVLASFLIGASIRVTNPPPLFRCLYLRLAAIAFLVILSRLRAI